MTFVPGLELSRAFFAECVAPAVDELAPGLRYAAALIGEGSEVLGYDTEVSTDHDWGPRVLLFVAAEDFRAAVATIMPGLETRLPRAFKGWPVSFADQDRPIGVDHRAGAAGSLTHGVELHDLSAWVRTRLGVGPGEPMPPLRWLAIPEQVLLSLTAGAVFRDDSSVLTTLRHQLSGFPRDVWLFKLGCQWTRIAEEASFVGRCGDTGDEIGSRLVTARLVQDAMRIALLIERRYAPYPKWFGRAFSELGAAPQLAGLIEGTLAAGDWRAREARLNELMLALAVRQQRLALPGAAEPKVSGFHGRPYQVINAGEIAEAVFAAIEDPAVRRLPRTGGIDQFSDNPVLLSRLDRSEAAARSVLTGL